MSSPDDSRARTLVVALLRSSFGFPVQQKAGQPIANAAQSAADVRAHRLHSDHRDRNKRAGWLGPTPTKVSSRPRQRIVDGAFYNVTVGIAGRHRALDRLDRSVRRLRLAGTANDVSGSATNHSITPLSHTVPPVTPGGTALLLGASARKSGTPPRPTFEANRATLMYRLQQAWQNLPADAFSSPEVPGTLCSNDADPVLHPSSDGHPSLR